ncbi:hypothetical protein B0T17DRAFT_502660 [Bombardia bombarda]|uniref:Uncharacterized protein n=1 Tax=Bombardia bombarda TaxID=252184 RepID=A0AA40CF23_9PEZI|nr:hypothetical protein B0T17DRAFT_502660 [Bombardia bombarda]
MYFNLSVGGEQATERRATLPAKCQSQSFPYGYPLSAPFLWSTRSIQQARYLGGEGADRIRTSTGPFRHNKKELSLRWVGDESSNKLPGRCTVRASPWTVCCSVRFPAQPAQIARALVPRRPQVGLSPASIGTVGRNVIASSSEAKQLAGPPLQSKAGRPGAGRNELATLIVQCQQVPCPTSSCPRPAIRRNLAARAGPCALLACPATAAPSAALLPCCPLAAPVHDDEKEQGDKFIRKQATGGQARASNRLPYSTHEILNRLHFFNRLYPVLWYPNSLAIILIRSRSSQLGNVGKYGDSCLASHMSWEAAVTNRAFLAARALERNKGRLPCARQELVLCNSKLDKTNGTWPQGRNKRVRLRVYCATVCATVAAPCPEPSLSPPGTRPACLGRGTVLRAYNDAMRCGCATVPAP